MHVAVEVEKNIRNVAGNNLINKYKIFTSCFTTELKVRNKLN
ncbi:MAG: hypothetical protein ACI8WT_001481 [Clostridium sp.]|jgi:hypothetical protein